MLKLTSRCPSLSLLLLALALAACAGSGTDDRDAPAGDGAGAAPGSAKAQNPPAPPAPLPPPVPGTAPENPYPAEVVERGRFLVTVGACGDCHTPFTFDAAAGGPVPDRARAFSGHPAGSPAPAEPPPPDAMMVIGATGTSYSMPFGVVYSPNLTPDIDTGMGSWTEEMFVNTFRTATHMGGGTRPILPPMPWVSLATLPREDLVAVFAYLRSLPPIRNGVPTTNPPQEVQAGMRTMNEAILKEIAAMRSGE